MKDEELYFVKKRTPIMPHVPDKTVTVVHKSRGMILKSLKAHFDDEDIFNKKAPWILVHLGKENEIIRSRPTPD